MRRIGSMVVCSLAVSVVLPAGASAALAASPWWHLASAARPAMLGASPARQEIQDLTVSGATGELFVLADLTPKEAQEIKEGKKGPEKFEIFEVGEASASVQAGLEAIYGSGNVTVAGGAGAQAGTEPYEITFVGALAYQPAGVVNTELSELVGFAGTASVTHASEGRNSGEVVVGAANLGEESVKASGRVTLTDRLPGGVSAFAVTGFTLGRGQPTPSGTCALAPAKTVTCEFTGPVAPYDGVEARITVGVETQRQAGETENNEVTVQGGAAPSVSILRPLRFGGEPAFGVEDYELAPEEEGGTADAQAGSHPFQLTSTLRLNQNAGSLTPALIKDLNDKLPAGLVGNPTPIPRCTLAQFHSINLQKGEAEARCPQQSAVGVATVMVNRIIATSNSKLYRVVVPVFNIEPAPGEPARFGFFVPEGDVPVLLDTSVRSGGDYGVTVSIADIAQAVDFLSSEVTFWGVPGDPRHNGSRGYACIANPESPECHGSSEQHPPPLLEMPTSCTGPLQSSVEADSWTQPGHFETLESEPMPAMDGCERLPFSPSIKVTPDGTAASTPTGLTVDVHVPQEESLSTEGLAEADPKDITVTLPEGVAVDPSGANGLGACSEGLVGFTGFKELVPPAKTATFTERLPNPLHPGSDFCPDASKIATATIKTPLLSHPIEGAVYLASQEENPFGSLLAMYIVAEDPVSGVLVKLAGQVHLTPTGQIATTFENSPQAPFEDAELHFFGGELAPLVTPSRCGAYTTTASFVPWTAQPSDAAALTVPSSSTFTIDGGPNGGACPGASLPFSPSLTGGTTSIEAGGLSPFTMTMSREDGQQGLQAIDLHTPAGLSGLLTGVELCPEPQASQGLCGPNSLIGETTVSVGLGGAPFSVKGGRVYITGPYEGAPFGLSIVNPAKAGPFDLEKDTPCDCVLVRAKIEVDPVTAALTVTSDDSGPYKIPTILKGIPLQIKHVNVTINRPGFTFNPTSCNPLKITGTIHSTEGTNSPVSVSFKVHDCATLGFKPAFSVSTSGKTSRANGASLHVKLVYPKAAFGTQANIRSVKVNLPKQLPSRLTTLQKACPDSTFNANPAACPAPSRIGAAQAITPLLPVPLAGPAYFVSHGGAKFPELVVVLSGYGTTVQLHAETFISKAGITSSTFRTVPDVPVGTFELTLPQGKFSALAANGNLCKSKLAMPTAFTAQNGMVIHQSTPISVTGCKPAIAVMSQRVKGNTATIVASVPSAGTLVASGPEIKRSVKRVAKAGTVTIGVTLSSHALRVLAKNPHQRVNAEVKLRFSPKHGAPLTAYVRLLLG